MIGKLITFEGTEGAGKSTQIRRLYEQLTQTGIPCMMTREPGGTLIGDRIRHLLLDPTVTDMKIHTEMLLYAASRAQLVEEHILPALADGKIVLCDRFVDSSIVYQGMGCEEHRVHVEEINRLATHGIHPARTYLLDISVREGRRRLVSREAGVDRMEMKDLLFHERVREGFLTLAREEIKRYKIIDGSQTESEIFTELWDDLFSLIFSPQGKRSESDEDGSSCSTGQR